MAAGHALIKRVLFATDFSMCARHAETYATFLAETYEASMEILHVRELHPELEAGFPTDMTMVYAEQGLRGADPHMAHVVQRIQQHAISVTAHQSIGIAPSVQICTAARDSRADVIVMGTHGRTGVMHVLMGSTAERVLSMAPCPVLTVREPKGEGRKRGPLKFEHITVPIDFSGGSADALEYGIQIAKDFGASLTLLHVLEPVPYGDKLKLEYAMERDPERVTILLKAMASTIEPYGLPVREVIRGGVPADSILEYLHTSAADLLVMGTHGRRGMSYVLQGSVAEAVLRRAPCPVLALKRAAFPPSHHRVVRMETIP